MALDLKEIPPSPGEQQRLRVTEVHHTTFLKLLVLAGENAERIMADKLPGIEVRDVEW
jgi:hypothetical protein